MNIATSTQRTRYTDPDRLALIQGQRRLSYGELDQQACRAANTLARMGIRQGDRVALCLPNVAEFVWCYLGALKLGGIVVSVNPALTADEVRFILDDSGASLLIALDEDSLGLIGACSTRVRLLTAATLARAMRKEPDEFAVADLPAHAPAAIVYTSGTTGFPKGATLSHGNIGFTMESKRHYLDIRPDDRLLVFLPLFHCFGQNAVMNAGLHSGAALVLHRGFDAERVIASVSRDGVTMICAVPTHFLVLEEAASREAMRGVRYFMSAAAPLPAELESRWLSKYGVPIHQGYGLTETSPFAAYNHLTHYRPGSIGTPIDSVEMAVMDIADGRILGPGEQGEIVIRGPNVMLGYWNRPEETNDAIRCGWFHTGDIGRLDSDGYFYIQDRVKDMVIIGGSNVYPAEVENALYQHPAVAEVAVYGVPHATLGECVRATVVRRPGVCVTADELLAHCGDHLARYKIPASIDFASSLPKTGAGKVLKRVLRSAAVSTAISRVESATDLERHTCGWMARELGIGLSAIDPARPFADYGFTSLMAVQLAGLLSQWLNREIAATITWEFSSARALARHLLPEVAEPDGPVLHQMAARIAELSDDEAEAILIDELGRLQGAAAGRR